MGEIEWCLLNSRKKEHEAFVAAISDFKRLGYLVGGISYKNGALEVICCPPETRSLSMDGVSESFKP
jgi:hypothetical protein